MLCKKCYLRGHTSPGKMSNLVLEYCEKSELYEEASPRVMIRRFQDPLQVLWLVGHS